MTDTTNTEDTQTTPEGTPEPSKETPEPSKADTQAEPQAKPEDTAEETPEPPKETPETPEEPSEVNVDSQINDLVNKFLGNDGKLSEDEKAELAKTGLSDDLFIALANGVEATRAAADQKVFDSVGGRETYDRMLDFAKENFSEEQKTAFNDALFSGNEHLAQLAVAGLKATMDSINKAPERKVDASGTTTATKGFESQQELISAMNNRRYGYDTNYTKEVDAKRSKTNW